MHEIPDPDCQICPRLATYRAENRAANPDWHNAPVPGWGDDQASLLILGLAPGRTGANRTGQPFTGDPSGDLLHATLAAAGCLEGEEMTPKGVYITNAVLCAPPGNKPTSAEIHACRPFLKARLAALPNTRTILALGQVAHQSAIKVCGGKLPKAPFAHGAVHRLHTGFTVIDSFHPSPLNTNTGRLTPDMLAEVLALALAQARGVS